MSADMTEAEDAEGETPLAVAVRHGGPGAALRPATTLHHTADHGATELCLRLLDHGAELDRRLHTTVAVHIAMLGGHAECALALISRGADVESHDEPQLSIAVEGHTASEWATD